MKFSAILAGAAVLGSALAEVDPIVIKVTTFQGCVLLPSNQMANHLPVRALNSSTSPMVLNCKTRWSMEIRRMSNLT